MLEGGCKKCGKLCSTGIDSYMISQGKIVEAPAVTVEILCYDCYDNHYSKEAIRDKKLNNLLTTWYFKYIGIKRIKNV